MEIKTQQQQHNTNYIYLFLPIPLPLLLINVHVQCNSHQEARERRHLNLQLQEESGDLQLAAHFEPLSSSSSSSSLSSAAAVATAENSPSSISSSSSSSSAASTSATSTSTALADYQQQQQQQQTTEAGNSNSKKSKRTLYACEEKQLQIECQRGEFIEVVRANYGRFSIQICNEHGQLDWKVNCMSQTSLPIVQDSCQSKQSCQLLASNNIFGDACPGTQKYLEVHYQCKQLSANGQPPTSQVNNTSRPTSSSSSSSVVVVGSSTTTTIPLDQPVGGGRIATAATKHANNNVIQPNELPMSEIIQSQSQSNKKQQPIFPQQHLQTIINGQQQQQQQQTNNQRQTITGPVWFPNTTPPPLPSWMPSVTAPPMSPPRQPTSSSSSSSSFYRPIPMCPEIVWRQIRWPQTEAGLVAQMPCPAHAHSLEPYPASLTCLSGGHWARRVQAARCQSNWLRNLTQRLEQGDSALSIVAELVQRTRPVSSGQLVSSQQQQQQVSWQTSSSSYLHSSGNLFGDDLANIGRVVRRTVDSMADLLNRIQDDKQRLAFSREMVQSLVELINNLSMETHLDAWLDLNEQAGERQRIAGQLVQSLESASVLLASTLTPSSSGSQQQQQQLQEESFIKTSESAYVSVRTLNLQQQQGSIGGQNKSIEVTFPNESSLFGTKWMNSEPQKFTLHLQTSTSGGSSFSDQQAGLFSTDSSSYGQSGNQNSLKIVFVMLKGIGAQMEQFQDGQSSSSSSIATDDISSSTTTTAAAAATNSQRLVVNSNLVSFSIVADPRYTIKVDLSAPIELVFKHLEPIDNRPHASSSPYHPSQPHCVYWDTSISGWMSDGCKLVDSNRTHSTCACTHLTTFALLTNSDDLLHPSLSVDSTLQQQQQQQAAKVQLESVESGIFLPAFGAGGHSSSNAIDPTTTTTTSSPSSTSSPGTTGYKLLYLIKMLNGHLFESEFYPNQQQQQQQKQQSSTSSLFLQPKLLVYISCVISAGLLALHLVAVAYNRAHASRLLRSMPTNPAPPLLVQQQQTISSSISRPQQLASTTQRLPGLAAAIGVHSGANGSSSLETTPTYGSNMDNQTTATNTSNEHHGQQHYGIQQQSSHNNNHHQSMKQLEQLQSSSCFDLIGNDYHHNHQLQSSAATAAAAAVTAATSVPLGDFKRQFQVPIHILVQLLLLQLLLILLVESQNYIHELSMNSIPNVAINQLHDITLLSRNSIGPITWFLVLSLYYLIGCLTFWLIGQLVELNLNLTGLSANNSSGGYSLSSTSSNWWSINSSPSNKTSSKQQQQQQQPAQQQLASIFAPSSISSTQSRDSPTDSTDGVKYGGVGGGQSIYGAGSHQTRNLYGGVVAYYGTNNLQQQQQQQQQDQSPSSFSSSGCSRSSNSLLGYLLNPSISQPMQLFLVHLCPCIFVTFIVWLSALKVSWFNSLTYTTSFGLQFVYWPLLVDIIGDTLAQSILLYYIPAICVVLFCWAMFMLRVCSRSRQEQLKFDSFQGHNHHHHHHQHQADFISNDASNALNYLEDSAPAMMHHHHSNNNSSNTHHNRQGSSSLAAAAATSMMRKPTPAASLVNPYGTGSTLVPLQQQHQNGGANNNLKDPQIVAALNKQKKAYCNDNRIALQRWQANDLKKAKFVCTILVALLALHSICWLSFFAHIQRALDMDSVVTQQRTQSSWWSQSWLMYTFASSNLALVLLIGWSQRRTFRRSAQLTGLTRLLSCISAGLCYSSSSRSSSSAAAAVARRRAHLYQRAAQQVAVSKPTAASPGPGAPASIKMSPSNQSLFLVSQRHQQQQQQQQQQHLAHHLASQSAIYQQPTYGVAAGTTYSTGTNGGLQLAASNGAQQHIYDSTSALNVANTTEQLNVMQLMHQQHRQEQFATMHHHLANRNISHHQPFHLQHQHQQQHTVGGRHLPMTLRPMGFADSRNQQVDHSQQHQHPLILDQVCIQQQQRQHQQQQTGEADGPLVAFSSCSSSSTSTSTDSSSQIIHQQQQATFGPLPLTSPATITTSTSIATTTTTSTTPTSPSVATMTSVSAAVVAATAAAAATNQQTGNQHHPARLVQATTQQTSGPQLFDYQQQQQEHIQCSRQQQQPASVTAISSATEQQHQYYSINSPPSSAIRSHHHQQQQQQQNFRHSDSRNQLRQQQQQAQAQAQAHIRQQQHHFSSETPNVGLRNVIDGNGLDSNIYDVANYALIP